MATVTYVYVGRLVSGLGILFTGLTTWKNDMDVIVDDYDCCVRTRSVENFL